MKRLRLSKPMFILLLVLPLTVLGTGAYLFVTAAREAGRQWEFSTRLYSAVTFSDIQTAKSLLDQGANPNSGDDGWLFLLRAIENKDKEMVNLLVARGANPSLALLEARNTQQAEALLRLGANVNARAGSYQETPLLSQAMNANVEMVRFLLAHGADVHVKDEQGNTLLARVRYVWGNHPEQNREYIQTVQLLKQAGAKE